jgi:AraC-like DNA-binding protein
LNGSTRQRIGAESVVLMNPGDVHACNPMDHERWSYRMLYVDVPWLVDIQRDLGVSRYRTFQPFSATTTAQPSLYSGLNRLYDVLTDRQLEPLQKHEAALTFMTAVQLALSPAGYVERRRRHNIARAAEFIRDNYKHSLRLEEISCAAGLSASYLIRAFKEEYGMTPHAYLINCRIEFARSQLRKGRPISAVALEAGFADQAHLQRAFKRIVAATPGQYRG